MFESSVRALGPKILAFQRVNKPSLWIPQRGLCVKVPLKGNAPCEDVGEGDCEQQILLVISPGRSRRAAQAR